jgi:prepilin peptidase CpaA
MPPAGRARSAAARRAIARQVPAQRDASRPGGAAPRRRETTMPPWLTYAWSFGLLGVVLIAAAACDVRSGKIPNVLTYPAVAAGLIAHTLSGGLTGAGGAMGLAGSLLGLAAGFLPMLAAWLAGGVGGGDAKLMAAVGALAGWRFAISALLFGFVVAAVMAVAVMVRRRIVRRTLGRVLRFVVLAFTPGRPADPAAADSPKVPLGLALCIGSALALAEALLRGPRAGKLILGI